MPVVGNTVDFVATPLLGAAPLSVAFTDLSSLYKVSWLWDFGDGSTSVQQNPAHSYLTAGTFTVTLTVVFSSGTTPLATTKTGYIVVSIPDATVDFVGTPLSGLAALTVAFTDLSVPTPTSWLWTFGDGTAGVEQNPVHVYPTPGVYTVSLTAGSAEPYTGYLLHFDGVDAPQAFVDAMPNTWQRQLATPGYIDNVMVSAANPKFGAGSLRVQTGSYTSPAFSLVGVPNGGPFFLNPGNKFTMSGWVWWTGHVDSRIGLGAVRFDSGGGTSAPLASIQMYTTGQFSFTYRTFVYPVSMPLNSWVFLEMGFDGTTLYWFVNGVLQGSTAAAAGAPAKIVSYGVPGVSSGNPSAPAGYVDESAFEINICRHTSNYTVPTTPTNFSPGEVFRITPSAAHDTTPFNRYHVPGWQAEGSSVVDEQYVHFDPYQTVGSFSNIVGVVDASPAYDLPADFEISFDYNGHFQGTALNPIGAVLFGRAEITPSDYAGTYTQSIDWAFFLSNDGRVVFYIPQGIDATRDAYVSGGNLIPNTWQNFRVLRRAGVLSIYTNGVLQPDSSPSTSHGVIRPLVGSQRIAFGGPYQTYSPLPNLWTMGSFRNLIIHRGVSLSNVKPSYISVIYQPPQPKLGGVRSLPVPDLQVVRVVKVTPQYS